MLENAVDGLTELRNVKTITAQLQVTTGTIISYDGYVSLLYSAAQSYDTQFSTRINSKGQKRAVYQHEEVSDKNNEEYNHHVDTKIEDLIINFTNLNVTKQIQKRARLNPTQWHELSSVSQKIWDKLDDESKSIILTPRQPRTNPPFRKSSTSNQTIPQQYKRRANLHEQDNTDNQNKISNEIVEYIP